MHIRSAVALTFLLLIGSVCLAQGFGNDCTPVGTWYGGDEASSAKYILEVSPGRAGHYNINFVQGFTPKVPRISLFAGEMMKTESGGVESYSIALLNNDLTPPPTAPAPDVRAAHSKIVFDGCNKLKSFIDFYGLYHWGAIPFIDDPVQNLIPAGKSFIEETYYRVVTECPHCPAE